eukprot:352816-Chlamydomonas_euryale.AAC.3
MTSHTHVSRPPCRLDALVAAPALSQLPCEADHAPRALASPAASGEALPLSACTRSAVGQAAALDGLTVRFVGGFKVRRPGGMCSGGREWAAMLDGLTVRFVWRLQGEASRH